MTFMTLKFTSQAKLQQSAWSLFRDIEYKISSIFKNKRHKRHSSQKPLNYRHLMYDVLKT